MFRKADGWSVVRAVPQRRPSPQSEARTLAEVQAHGHRRLELEERIVDGQPPSSTFKRQLSCPRKTRITRKGAGKRLFVDAERFHSLSEALTSRFGSPFRVFCGLKGFYQVQSHAQHEAW